jgi:hypothetical protein
MLPAMFRALIFLAAVAAPALAGPAFSGIEAIRSQPYGDSARAVEVRGERGTPQPREWTILLSDTTARGGAREVTFADGKIVAERAPLRGLPDITGLAPLDTARLACDSDRAFRIVQDEATKRQVGFHWLDYSLRTDPASDQPEWTIRLFDHMGAPVGTIRISASTGDITRPLRTTARKESAPPSRPIGGLVGTVVSSVERVAKTTANSTLRVVGNVQETLVGERTIGPKEDE